MFIKNVAGIINNFIAAPNAIKLLTSAKLGSNLMEKNLEKIQINLRDMQVKIQFNFVVREYV